MPTPGVGTIGSLDFTPEERKKLAAKYVVFYTVAILIAYPRTTNFVRLFRSQSYVCPECGKITDELATGVSKPATEEEKSLIDCVAFKVKFLSYFFQISDSVFLDCLNLFL